MGNRYYITGVQLGILMQTRDERDKMDILNQIMNDQQLSKTGTGMNKNE